MLLNCSKRVKKWHAKSVKCKNSKKSNHTKGKRKKKYKTEKEKKRKACNTIKME